MKKRTYEETEPEGDSNERERLGAILGLGVVGDVRLRERDIPRRRPIDDARQIDHPQGRGARQKDEAEERSRFWLAIRSGLRPKRSDALPRRGADTS